MRCEFIFYCIIFFIMKFKLSLITILASLGMSLPAFTQCLWSGQISDSEDHSPITGASIYFPDLKKGTITDASGKFKIENLPNGKYLAEIKQFGYQTISSFINVCENPTLNFTLSPSVVETQEVVVTGSSKATELLKMPSAVTTIDRATLFKTTSTNIIDALTSKPGIAQITTGAGISKPVIRGLGYNRIITLNDGIRQEGQQWGDEHGIEIDEFSASKIEILKGPASLMYGSDAIAGVINILSAPNIAEGSIGGNITTTIQSNNGLCGISGMQNGNIKNISWMARVSFKNAGNYKNNFDGRVLNSAYNEYDASANLGINKKWGYSHIIFSSFNQNIGLIEGERDSSSGFFVRQIKRTDSTSESAITTASELNSRLLNIPNQHISHTKIACDNSLILTKGRLSLLAAYQQNSRKEFADVLEPNTPGLNLALNTWTYDLKYFFPERKNRQITLGSNGMFQNNKNLGDEVLIPEYYQADYGGFVYYKKEINTHFNIAGGLRYDIRNYKSDLLKIDSITRFFATMKTFQNMSGSIGFTYAFNKFLVFKVNMARGYRAPQAAEISSNGLHEGTFRYEIGNINLNPETSYQADLGILYNTPHLTIDAAVFSNNIHNYIYLNRLLNIMGQDSISDPLNPTPSYQFVQGDAKLDGGEISIDLHPHPFHWLHFENTFSYVNAVNKNQGDSSKYLPFTPPTHITSEIRADIKKLNTNVLNCYFLLNVQAFLKQNKVLLANNTETSTPGYALFNAAVGSEIISRRRKPICSIVLAINNITNCAYQSHLSRLKYAPENHTTGRTGVYNMGRNMSIKAQFPIRFK